MNTQTVLIIGVGLLVGIPWLFRPRPPLGTPILIWTSQGEDLGFPVAVTPGMVVDVEGENWPRNSRVIVEMAEMVLVDTRTNASGQFSGSFTVPTLTPGTYIAETSSGTIIATTPFQVGSGMAHRVRSGLL